MFKPGLKTKPLALKNQKGQSFLEFIFLLMILITVSFGFLKGFSSLVGGRWEVMLKIIAKPNQSSISLP